MRALFVIAALLFAAPAAAWTWDQRVMSVANAPLHERRELAQRHAQDMAGAAPTRGTARETWWREVNRNQDRLMAEAEAARERLLGPIIREQEHARLRIICEGQARQARDYWPAFHSCWAANSRR